MEIPATVDEILARTRGGNVVWLTGAGISAESGIPTFRGEGGYWRVGSRNYRAQELATFAAFQQMPAEVWSWYLWRRSVCQRAQPNAAHEALAILQAHLGDRCTLLTQNVDGLHLRAGSPLGRTYQVHGNIDFMRAVGGGPPVLVPLDTEWERDRQITPSELARLVHEGRPTRPHVLWFDETYDEENFRFESALRAAASADLLIVVGSQGTTNLPLQVATLCARRGVASIVVDPFPWGRNAAPAHSGTAQDDAPPTTPCSAREPHASGAGPNNAFAELARSSGGAVVTGLAGAVVPELASRLTSW